MKNSNTIISQSTMSNLVGMWALIWNDEGKLKSRAFIQGKANETYFIVQAVNAMTGEPNVAKLMTIEQMLDWTFLPTVEIAEKVLFEYRERGKNDYTFSF